MMKFDHKVPAKMKHQVWMAHKYIQSIIIVKLNTSQRQETSQV